MYDLLSHMLLFILLCNNRLNSNIISTYLWKKDIAYVLPLSLEE